MKLFSASQIKQWDRYTIEHTPIASIDLMERAAKAAVDRILQLTSSYKFLLFCGSGNNGGDGLAIARLLYEMKYDVEVVFYERGTLSNDTGINLNKLRSHALNFFSVKHSHEIDWNRYREERIVIIDALFGIGLNRSLEGDAAEIVKHINALHKKTIAIDLPSGLLADQEMEEGDSIVKASQTITFQIPKRTFFYSSSQPYAGNWHVEDIGLSHDFEESVHTDIHYTTIKDIVSLYKARNTFSHKGNFGRGLLMAGSYGMMGAAVLSARACLRSGIGLLKVYTPRCGYEILQTTIPEAMVLCDKDQEAFTDFPIMSEYNALAIGPGWQESSITLEVLKTLLTTVKLPMVIDAGALNLISRDKNLLLELSKGSILTPHHKEFERLCGKSMTRQETEVVAIQWAKEMNVCIVLKGKNTAVVLPNGSIHYNSTGNVGMAKGGSGDCLTGILLALLAQGYSSEDAVRIGVFMHGYAGDRAAIYHSKEAMLPSDLIECIGEFFEKMNS